MIQINNLQKIENGTTVIDINGLIVQNGEIIGIIGAAGSGLSTLRDLLIGKTRPSAGKIVLSGMDTINDKEALSTKIGVLFKENGLYVNQTAAKNLVFFAKLYGLPRSRVDDILHSVGLADQASKQIKDLPSGLTRRLAYARSVLNQPISLILEQPFEQCDEKSILILKESIRQEAEKGTSVIILNEDTANLEDLCTRMFTLTNGHIEDINDDLQKPATHLPFKIPVKLEGRVALLNPAEILFIEASQGHTFLHTLESNLPSQYTLSELEDRLKRSGFFRAHRSYLVNLQHVQEVIPYSRNSFSLRLTDSGKTEIPLSKNAAAELRELLDY